MSSSGLDFKGSIDIAPMLQALKDLSKKAKETGVDLKTLLNTDKEAQALVQNLKTIQNKLGSELPKATETGAAGVGKMNLALGQFGYLISDADMFMVNFRMGMMSIANNVPMFVQFMQYAKQEAKDMNMTLGQAFMQSIKGPGGLLLGVNAAMFGIQLLTRAFSSSSNEIKKEIDSQKKEIDSLIQKYRDLASPLLNQEKGSLEFRKKFLESSMRDMELSGKGKEQLLYKESGGVALSTFTFENKSDQEFYDRLKSNLKDINQLIGEVDKSIETQKQKVSQIMANTFDISTPARVKEAVQLLQKEWESSAEKERGVFTEKIKHLTQILQLMNEELNIKNKLGSLSSEEQAAYRKILKDNEQAVSLMISDPEIYSLTDPRLNEGKLDLSGSGGYGKFRGPVRTSGPGVDNIRTPAEVLNETLREQQTEAKSLDTVFRNTGNTMANAFINAIRQGRTFAETLGDIGNAGLNLALTMSMQGLFGGLFNLLSPGGGFFSGFLGAIGINSRANGGLINEPVLGVGLNSKSLWSFGERGNEWVTPMDKFRVPQNLSNQGSSLSVPREIELKARGNDLFGVIRIVEKRNKRYGKS